MNLLQFKNTGSLLLLCFLTIFVAINTLSYTGDDSRLEQQQSIPFFSALGEKLAVNKVAVEVKKEDKISAQDNRNEYDSGEYEGAISEKLDPQIKTSIVPFLTLMSVLVGFALFFSGVIQVARASKSEGHLSPLPGFILIMTGSTLSIFSVLFKASLGVFTNLTL